MDGAGCYLFLQSMYCFKRLYYFCKVRSCAMQGRSVLFFPVFVEKTQRIIPIANVYLTTYMMLFCSISIRKSGSVQGNGRPVIYFSNV